MLKNQDSSSYNWKSYSSKDRKLYGCDYTNQTHSSTWKANLGSMNIDKNSSNYGSLSFIPHQIIKDILIR